jgi:protein SCO1/2
MSATSPPPGAARGEDRRSLLKLAAAGLPGLALPSSGAGAPVSEISDIPPCRPGPEHFPNVVVQSHLGGRALFWDDLIRDRAVLLHLTSAEREAEYPVLANLARVQPLLGDRLGREVFFYSITTAPERDTPLVLREMAERCGAGPGWLFLTAAPADAAAIRNRLFVHDMAGHAGHAQAGPPAEDCSRGLLRYGNAALGLWGSVPARAEPRWIAERLLWVLPRPAPVATVGEGSAPRRRGPRPLSEQPWAQGRRS